MRSVLQYNAKRPIVLPNLLEIITLFSRYLISKHETVTMASITYMITAHAAMFK